MKSKPKTVDEYIEAFPEEIQQRLKQIRDTFTKSAHGIGETIRYNMPAFKVGREHLYIAAYKKHIGMYPMYGMDDIENELKVFRGKNTKDALHFPHDKPLPLGLIEKIVETKLNGI